MNVYSKGKLRLYCVIIGMIVGYVSSFLFGLLDTESIAQVKDAPLFSFPYIEKMRWAFDFHLMIPFTIAALASTFKTVGDISTCQRINDTKWKRTDMKTVSGGILVDGIGGILPGVVGRFGQSTSSSNVGLSVATGATSRIIAWFVGGLLIFLAFFPKLANVFIIMPKPVMGAVLIFSVSFMIIQGFQMVMSRMLDSRKIFVEVKAKFNEYALEVEMLYKGRKIDLPEMSPDPGKVETDPEWETKLAGFLIPKFCDKIKVSGRGETSKVWMKFEH